MEMVISDSWKLKGFDENSQCEIEEAICNENVDGWLEVEVPGDVHSTLLKNKIIEDPFYSTNVEKCRWVEDKIWIYKNEFYFEKNIN